jgi:hypothetical protein
MAFLRTHWKAVAASTVLFLIGIGIGAASGGSTKTDTVAGPTVTATTTRQVTVTHTTIKRIRVKPAGPSGSIPGDGTFLVGKDIAPGTYRAAAATSGNCYWERERDLNDNLNSIIANDNTAGPVVLQVLSSDYAVKTTGCETFSRIG